LTGSASSAYHRVTMRPLAPGDLTYNSYLRVPELLSLQTPQSDPPHHDELLFIIIHQAYELWFRLILHELGSAMMYMEQGDVLRAHHFLRRVVTIQRVLVDQIHILETMSPIEFLAFRDRLNPASGFQSLQFREIEFLCGLKNDKVFQHFATRPEELKKLQERAGAPDLPRAFHHLLAKKGFNMPEESRLANLDQDPEARQQVLDVLIELYSKPDDHLEMYLLAESLVDLDQQLSLWRSHHVKVVERVIGMKPGTGGSEGVSYLLSTLDKRCFPLLWQVRFHLGGAPAPYGGS
jgi:tryptophan 2,3-dioxygenase